MLLLLLQFEGKNLHHQKNYNSLYCDICFIVVLWKNPVITPRYACPRTSQTPQPSKSKLLATPSTPHAESCSCAFSHINPVTWKYPFPPLGFTLAQPLSSGIISKTLPCFHGSQGPPCLSMEAHTACCSSAAFGSFFPKNFLLISEREK